LPPEIVESRRKLNVFKTKETNLAYLRKAAEFKRTFPPEILDFASPFNMQRRELGNPRKKSNYFLAAKTLLV
jgi:hypothetical protein